MQPPPAGLLLRPVKQGGAPFSSFMMFVCLLSWSMVAHAEDQAPGTRASTTPTSIATLIAIRGDRKVTEYHYDVDLVRREIRGERSREMPADESTASQQVWVEQRRLAEQAYQRIAELVRDGKSGLAKNPDLAWALHWIERRKGAGYSAADSIFASLDGSYAVYAHQSEPLLLINVATLKTLRLAESAGMPRTPVAWGHDSRYVAFALPRKGVMHMYDVQQHGIASSKSGDWQWLEGISWSPDGRHIAAVGTKNRVENRSLLGRLAAAAGHPEFRNDIALYVYELATSAQFSVVLKRGLSEWGSPDVRIEWK